MFEVKTFGFDIYKITTSRFDDPKEGYYREHKVIQVMVDELHR